MEQEIGKKERKDKALSDPTRRKVLELLRQRAMSAVELADHFPVSRPTMSAHFAVLRHAELIEATRIGTSIIYQLKLSVLEDALLGFTQLFGIGIAARPTAEPADDPEPTDDPDPGQPRKGVDP